MLRTLAFIAMRQEDGQAAETTPLGKAGGDELVEDHLGAVGEVAELRFPHHQGFRIGGGITVLEAQHTLLRQQRVVDREAVFAGHQRLQRGVACAVLVVMHGGMAMEEGAALHVLAAEAHVEAFVEIGRVSHGLGETPVHRQLAGRHARAVLVDFLYARMQREAFRQRQQLARQRLQLVTGHQRFGRRVPAALTVLGPVDGVLVADQAQRDAGNVLALVEAGTVILGQRLGVAASDGTLFLQALGIQRHGGRVLLDRLVHHRAGYRRLVGLVVTPAAVAADVDDDVLVELVAEVHRQARDEHHRLRIVAVHMEHRRFQHLGQVGAVARRARLAARLGLDRVRRGEADLVVDDHMQRAAGAVALGVRQLQRLHDHALAGEGGVAVDQDRHHALADVVAARHLARLDAALHHRVHDLQVRGIEGQHQVQALAGHFDVGREAHVVLHVAGTAQRLGGVLAFELGEQVRRRLAQQVDQHVEAAAVGHADDDFLDVTRGAALQHLVQRRDLRVAAFQREALLADVLVVQVALQALGRHELLEDFLLAVGGQLGLEGGGLEALLDPALLRRLRDVHVLGADGVGVDRLQQLDDVLQRQAVRAGQRAGVEHRLEVLGAQAVEGRIEIAHRIDRGQAQRVELGHLVATDAVVVDQPQDAGLLLGGAGIEARLGGGDTARLSRHALEARQHFAVSDLARGALVLHVAEVGPPARIDRIRILEELLVVRLDIGRVGTLYGGRFDETLILACRHILSFDVPSST